MAAALLLLAAAVPVFATQGGGAGDEPVTLNFEAADIRSVIAMVSERTGRNFIVDPRVRGEVTIISHRPVDSDQLYQVFLSALQIHGFAAIPADGAVRIVPRALARRDHTEVAVPAERDGYEFITWVIHPEHVEAAELVPILRPLVSDEGHMAAYPKSNALVLSESAGNIERIRRLVARVDRDTTGVTEVVPLRHASAVEVVGIVERMEPEERAGRRLLLAADERTNSVLIGGDPARRPAVRALVRGLDEPTDDDDGTAVIYLRYADAVEMVPILEGLAEGLLSTPDRESGRGITIHAHESTNALVISGPPGASVSLGRVVRRLDVRRAQVLVEAIIAEVSMERLHEFGVQWGALGDSGVGLVNFGVAGDGSLITLGEAAQTRGQTGVPRVDGLVAGAADERGNIGVLLRALAGDSDTNVLSTPSVMTMDNEEAQIVVGQNVPFITGRAIEDSGQAFSAIQRQDVGVQLRIRPQINEGDAIKLAIEKEVSALAGRPEGAEDLVTNTRLIHTTAMVDDGQIIVLGGLMDDQARTTQQRVPWLGDIPGLGWLFRYQRTQVEKRNLMVFLRPRIVHNRDDAREVTSPKYQWMRNQQLAARARGLSYLDDDLIPVLSESRDLMYLPPPFEERGGQAREGRRGIEAPPRWREPM